MIRLAKQEDMPEIMRMGESFYEDSGYQDIGDFNSELVETVINQLIDNETLLIGDGGMIGWIQFPVFMTGTSVAQELFWWVDKDKRKSGVGLDLLKQAQKKAKSQGSEHMFMLCLNDLDGEKVEKIYSHMGYKPRERTFMRAL